MAEFKTYTCDTCGAQGAKRFSFPRIDSRLDASGDWDSDSGDVDLCFEHTQKIFDLLLKYCGNNEIQQNLSWKTLLGK